MTIRAISLTQPWASFVVWAVKKYETRSWKTPYQGVLLVHAAKALPHKSDSAWDNPLFTRLLRAHEVSRVDDLPRGSLVGWVTLTGCHRAELVETRLRELGEWTELALGNYGPHRWAWSLILPHVLDQPIPCRGALGIWDVPVSVCADLPKKLIEAIDNRDNDLFAAIDTGA